MFWSPGLAVFVLFFALSSLVSRSWLRTGARALVFGIGMAPTLAIGHGIAVVPSWWMLAVAAGDHLEGRAPFGYDAEDGRFLFGLAGTTIFVTSLLYVIASMAIPRRTARRLSGR